MTMFHVFKILLVFLLASCGEREAASNQKSVRIEQQNLFGDEGTYRAVLSPLNKEISGETSGTVQLILSEDNFSVQSNIVGSPASSKHFQQILTSSRCPDQTADVNNDSFIDIVETISKSGSILIPLDTDLSDQFSGMNYGPISNTSGNYVYRRTASLTSLLSDLYSVDPDHTDFVEKLPPGKKLNLENRVVVILGIRDDAELPPTVGSFGDFSAFLTIPIACGKLERVIPEDEFLE